MAEASERAILDDAVNRIASRVTAVLRADIADLARAAANAAPTNSQMSVEQVAQRLGVARSTVYAHWREWGGYKLGPGAKAPIRFDPETLPSAAATVPPTSAQTAAAPPGTDKRRAGAELLSDSPRLPLWLDAGN